MRSAGRSAAARTPRQGLRRRRASPKGCRPTPLKSGSALATDYVPDDQTLVRYVKPSHVGRENGVVAMIFPQAFELREDEDYLSAGWLEDCAGSTRALQITACKGQFAAARKVPK